MDIHDQTILVTGATGNQGGATARHLLADRWHVRALVRDDTTPATGARRHGSEGNYGSILLVLSKQHTQSGSPP